MVKDAERPSWWRRKIRDQTPFESCAWGLVSAGAGTGNVLLFIYKGHHTVELVLATFFLTRGMMGAIRGLVDYLRRMA